jgi:hypothetical protein
MILTLITVIIYSHFICCYRAENAKKNVKTNMKGVEAQEPETLCRSYERTVGKNTIITFPYK